VAVVGVVAHDVAGVDDELGLAGHALVVEAVVVGDDDHRVVVGEGAAGVDALEVDAVLVDLGGVGVGVRDPGAALVEARDDVEGGRLADVGDVLLVGDAGDQHAGAVQRLLPVVERVDDAADDVLGHGAVHLVRQVDELGLHLEGPELPAQVEGVDGDAVAPEPWPREEGHEAEGLGGGGADDLEGVDSEPARELGHLVDEADVDRAEGVLQQLDHLGGVGARHGDHVVDDLRVEGLAHGEAPRRGAAEDLGRVAGAVVLVARIDPLGAEADEDVLAQGEAPGQRRDQHLAGGARVGGGLQHDEHVLVLVLRDLLGGREDVADVRLLGLVERGGDADDDGVRLGQDGGVGGGVGAPLLDERPEHRGRDVLDVGVSLVEPLDLSGVLVVARHPEASAGELDDQGETDVADPDDDDAGGALLDFLAKCTHVRTSFRRDPRRPRSTLRLPGGHLSFSGPWLRPAPFGPGPRGGQALEA
jgi:hypothetical protein